MTGKYPWIVLLVTLHISVVLCRSTEKPKDEENVVHEGPILFPHGHASVVKSVDQYFAPNMGEPTPESPVPSKMSYDIYVDEDTYVTYQRTTMNAAAIVGIVMGLFCLISLLIGCILLCCCQKEKRRQGFILRSNTMGQTSGTEQPGIVSQAAPGAIQPMQHYPPPYGQAQQQNIYPAVNPSN